MPSTQYTYDIQFTNSNNRVLHIYVMAQTNTEAILKGIDQLGEWGIGSAITNIHVEMLTK